MKCDVWLVEISDLDNKAFNVFISKVLAKYHSYNSEELEKIKKKSMIFYIFLSAH